MFLKSSILKSLMLRNNFLCSLSLAAFSYRLQSAVTILGGDGKVCLCVYFAYTGLRIIGCWFWSSAVGDAEKLMESSAQALL